MEKYNVIIIGGGPSAMEAAIRLNQFGHSTLILEKDEKIGGKLNKLDKLFPDFYSAEDLLQDFLSKIEKTNIKIETSAYVEDICQEGNEWKVITNSKEYRSDCVLLASGYDYFDASRKEEYGYGIYPNVITSIELEAMIKEKKVRTLDGRTPKNIAFVQCVGSRDEKVGNHYCSINCCICAVKQSIEVQEIINEVKQYCFYMDLRMSGQFYEELYRKSQEKHNVEYIRGRVSELSTTIDNRIQLKTENTLLSTPLKLTVDMVVLMIGMEASASTLKFAKKYNIANDYGFILSKQRHLADNETEIKGLFVSGTCKRPLTIPKTIKDGAAAAAEIDLYLKNLL